MKFKCGPCDQFWVTNEANALVKGEFDVLSEAVQLPKNKWYAKCSLCGAEWGPCVTLHILQQKMIDEGVLK